MNEAASDSWQGKMLGRYQLSRQLGRGGMGEVWLAVDMQLRRQIAVKLLPAVYANDQHYLQAFEREARAAAGLDHPNILPVHDFGQQQTAPDTVTTYLIMPYIAGGSLRDRIRGIKGPLPPEEALHYLRQVAQAIDYAHGRHVLHRDIKPANMLLQQHWVFLTDFGIAKLLDSATQRGQTGRGAGTPGFMAPEQAQGHAERASDVYSLAVTAYLLLAGRQPFSGDTPFNILIQQSQSEPPLPRELNPALSPVTQQVLLWGLAKRPADRPPSCIAFVQALEQSFQPQSFATTRGDPEKTVLAPWAQYRQEQAAGPPVQLTGQPIPPMPVTPSMPAQPSFAPPTPYAAGSQTIMTTAPGQGTFTDQPQSFPAPVTEMPPSTPPAPRVARRSVLIGAGIGAVALAGLGVGGYELYRHFKPAPQAAAKLPPGPRKLMSGVPVLALTGHTSAVESVAWDPTGRYLASGSDDTYIMLWDIGSLAPKSGSGVKSVATPLRKWKIANPTNSTFLFTQDWLHWSTDGKSLAVIIQDNEIRLYDAFSSATAPHIYQNTTAASNNSFTAPAYVNLAWSPKANTFATYDINSEFSPPIIHVDLWKTTQPDHPVQTLLFKDVPAKLTGAGINVLAWSADGSLLAGHTDYEALIIWDAATGTVKQVFSQPSRSGPGLINNECLTWSPIDPHLLASSDLDIAIIWDVQQSKQALTLKVNDPGFTPRYVWAMSWAPNGQYMAMSYPRNPRIYVWDVRTTGAGAAVGTTRTQTLAFPAPHAYGHTKAVIDVAWSPDGRYIASAGGDDLVIIWKVDAG